MSDESETPAERVSRFREHTNTNSSIRAPPAELWRDLDTEALMDKFHDDDNAGTPAVKRQPVAAERRIAQPRGGTKAATTAATTAASSEGALGRFSRVFASVFGGVLGKRKAGHADAEPVDSTTTVSPEQAVLDDRKRAAEEAYHLAKAQGLLPAPKVFVRPGMAPRAWSAGTSSSSRSSIRLVEADDARHGRGGHHYYNSNNHHPNNPKHSYTRTHSYPVPTTPAPRPTHPGKRRKIAHQGRPDQAEEALAPRQQPRGEARDGEKGTRKRPWE